MRKVKRKELVRQILDETGLTGKNKTPAYFTRNQLLDLLVLIRDYKTKIASLTVKENTNERIENTSGN